ncbi:integrin alpha-M-like isoform X2 [Scyliorhinus canicula]|uniref:integrin alpha-M-like isoform X2 n=1 Tax=Scyliorhinus canicula TaxID=7830 RepID=UPI0018F3FAB0|nr:integrin alpha-M-like isoform X2 [Scyliorhinus canicula]
MERLMPDNWGILQANITYRLQLDKGRQHGRAVFQRLSRSLTSNLQLRTGRKRCQEFPIRLPSCVMDYFEPIDLSLNFTLAGEVIPDSKGLRPILNEYTETSQTYKLLFQMDCGLDNKCEDYLRICFNFSGGDMVVIGRATVLIATVVLENAHEDSSNTQLNFLHPSYFSFKKISMVQESSVQIVCSDQQNDRLMASGSLRCAVNPPVFKKGSRVMFNTVFDITATGIEETSANFTITATSENSVRIKNESSYTRSMLLRYAVNVAASGIEYTRHLNFTAGHQEERLVKHSYQVENLAPRSLPIRVKLTFPTRIGDKSLWNVTVTQGTPGNRSICQPLAQRLAAVQSETVREAQDYVRLDCGIALCTELLCEVAVLEEHGVVIFHLKGELMSAAIAELKVKKLLLISKVSLSYDGEKYVDISEVTAPFKEVTLETEVEVMEEVNRLPMIIGGSIGGLLLLIVLIIVFYKALHSSDFSNGIITLTRQISST